MLTKSNPGTAFSFPTSLRVSNRFEEGNFADFSSEIFLAENNLFFFHVGLNQTSQIFPFLKEKVTLSSAEEEKVGYLRKPTEQERSLFIERKLGEMLSYNVRMGQVFILALEDAA